MARYKIGANATVCTVYQRALDELKAYVSQHQRPGTVLVATDPFVNKQTEIISFIQRSLLSAPNVFSYSLSSRSNKTALRYMEIYGWCLLFTINEQTKTVWVEHAEEMSPGKRAEDVVRAYLGP